MFLPGSPCILVILLCVLDVFLMCSCVFPVDVLMRSDCVVCAVVVFMLRSRRSLAVGLLICRCFPTMCLMRCCCCCIFLLFLLLCYCFVCCVLVVFLSSRCCIHAVVLFLSFCLFVVFLA